MNIEAVTTMRDAQDIRAIRNSIASFLTHDQRMIRDDTQAWWFDNIYKPAHAKGDMHAFKGSVDGLPMAYGLVNNIDGKFNLTGGIREIFRGEGFGRELFQFLTDFTLAHCADIVYLDVAMSNAPARALYESLGFEETHRQEGLIYMRKGQADV